MKKPNATIAKVWMVNVMSWSVGLVPIKLSIPSARRSSATTQMLRNIESSACRLPMVLDLIASARKRISATISPAGTRFLEIAAIVSNSTN